MSTSTVRAAPIQGYRNRASDFSFRLAIVAALAPLPLARPRFRAPGATPAAASPFVHLHGASQEVIATALHSAEHRITAPPAMQCPTSAPDHEACPPFRRLLKEPRRVQIARQALAHRRARSLSVSAGPHSPHPSVRQSSARRGGSIASSIMSTGHGDISGPSGGRSRPQRDSHRRECTGRSHLMVTPRPSYHFRPFCSESSKEDS